MSDSSDGLALFDFDGTLIPCDSQVLFAGYVLKRRPWRRLLMLAYLCATPAVVLGKAGELVLKRLFLVYLWGMRRDEINRMARGFFEERIKPILYEPVTDELKKHQDRHDYCVLVTASPSVYADCIGEGLGFDRTISTRVEFGDRFPFFPVLPDGNNKGANKVGRLEEEGMIGDRRIAAYSDSRADLPMLLLANECTLVNPSSGLARMFGDRAAVFTLPRLWKNRFGKLVFLARNFFGFY